MSLDLILSAIANTTIFLASRNGACVAAVGAAAFYVVALINAFKSLRRPTKVRWWFGAVFFAVICLISVFAWLQGGASNVGWLPVSSVESAVNKIRQLSAQHWLINSPRHKAPVPVSGEDQPLNLPALAHQAGRAVALIVCYDSGGNVVKTGSGFFISADGRLVTNDHVVRGIAHAQAKLESGAIYNINGVLAASGDLDIAVLKADARGVEFLAIGDASPPEAGTRIAVIGSPVALENTLSEGIVSAIREEGSWLQISAPISPGSSGSPVLDPHGRVIGIATLVVTQGQNLNFARSCRDLIKILADIAGDATPVAFASPPPEPTILDDPQFKSAIEANDRGDGAQALELLNQVGERFPRDRIFIAFERGRAYFHLSLFEDSFLAFRQYAKWRPTEITVWHNMMRAAYFANRLDDALNAGWQETKMKPDADTLSMMSTIYYNRGELALALTTIEQANKVRTMAAKPSPSPTALPTSSPGFLSRDWSIPDSSNGRTGRRSCRVIRLSPTDELWVHTEAREDSPSLATLHVGDQLYLETGRVRNDNPPPSILWQKITTMAGHTGWVKADYIGPSSE